MKSLLIFILTVAIGLVLAAPASADMVWPALYLMSRTVTWWAIALGLLVEYLFLRRFIGLGTRNAVKVDTLMNLVSATAGTILIALAGILWEVEPGALFYFLFHVGTFNPVTWSATFLMAVLINAAIEGKVISYFFKQKLGRKGFLWLCAANAASVAVAAISIRLFPLSYF